MSGSFCSVFGVAVVAIFAAGYWAQSSLPPPKPKIVGIDLGTTFSCIGSFQGGYGNITIYKDSAGNKCIPSVISFSGADVLVGYSAVEKAELNSKNTIYDAKRFIGKKFEKADFQREQDRYPFKLILNETTKQVYFQVEYDGRSVLVSPEEVGAHILTTLKQTAEQSVGGAVGLCVMSVPAEFDEMQRNATRDAAVMAGFKVLRTINEPTAAALAYGLHKKDGARTVMVVDLGGGTLDVSLLAVQGGMFLTMAMAGNNHLGGQDFNERLMARVVSAAEAQFGSAPSLPEDLQAIRQQVEQSKLRLSTVHETLLRVRLLSYSSKHTNSGVMFEYKLTRAEFESLVKDLVDQVLEPIIRVLVDVEMGPEDVNDVVMVGGSTRVPRVREAVAEFFGGKALSTRVDPELAVVSGTAVQGGVLLNSWPVVVSAIEVPAAVNKIQLG